MKTKLFIPLLLFICSQSYSSEKFVIPINVSPHDAEVLVDGKLMGVGNLNLNLKEAKTFNLVIQRKGYLPQKVVFKYLNSYLVLHGLDKTDQKYKDGKVYSKGENKTYYFTLTKDDRPIDNEQNSEEQQKKEKSIIESKKIFFYGYDFTKFKLIDPKRFDQDIKKFVFIWTAFCQEQGDEKHLKKWLRKDTIVFNFHPTVSLNEKLNSKDLVGVIKNEISEDTLQILVSRYNIKEKDGIGLVSIVECFDNANKTTSAFYVFFDISTKKIITQDYISLRDGNSYNRVLDWGGALLGTVKKFKNEYNDKLEPIVFASEYKEK